MELREALSAAVDDQEKDDGIQNQEPAVESSAPAPDAEVSEPESGEGNASEKSVAPEKDAERPVDKADEKAVKEDAPAVGQHRVDRPPVSWRKEAKGEWGNIPLHVRQEVYKREMEITKALNDANTSRAQATQFEQVAQPYMARIQSLGVSPQQAFSELLKADYLLASGSPQSKAQLLDKLIQDYGVDVVELDAAIARRLNGQPQQQPQQPDIQALVQQQLQQALAPIYQQQAQQQQRVVHEATQTVEQMSLDPKYPYFDDVRQDMADMLELASRRGLALSLDQAYSRAVGMNPDLSASISATQQNQVAQRAKAAAASVSGAPTGVSQQHQSSGSLRDDILAAMSGGRL